MSDVLRANIYRFEPLEPEIRGAIDEGIGMVAAHMGHTILTQELGVRLPLDQNGLVNPRRVGVGKLNEMVELHLMAVPLDGGPEGVMVGNSRYGRGVGFVDSSISELDRIRSLTSHEVAHSFGFVLLDAEHADPTSDGHCRDGDCIMNKTLTSVIELLEVEVPVVSPEHRWWNFGRAKKSTQDPEIELVENLRLLSQFDFCSPCKSDMRNKGEANMYQLRYNRLLNQKVL